MTTQSTAARWVQAALASEVPEGEILGLILNGHEIALYHLPDGSFHATDNVCTHGQALLSDGWIVDDCNIECPLHAGCFDVRTGKAMGPPIDQDIRTYPVRQEGEALFVEIVD